MLGHGQARCAQARPRDLGGDARSRRPAGPVRRESRGSDPRLGFLETMHLQLACDVPRGWLGRAQSEADCGAPAQAVGSRSAVALPHGDRQEPAAAGFPVRVVDAGHDCQAHPRAHREAPQSGLGGAIAGAAGSDVPEAAVARLSAGRLAGRAVAEEGVPADPGLGEEGKGADLLRRRVRHTLGLPCRKHVGGARQHALWCASPASASV